MNGHDDVSFPTDREPIGNPADSTEAAVAADSSTREQPASGGTPDLASVMRQRDEYQDLLLRRSAEFDNYRKRIERERRELTDYTNGEFAKELLPIVDDFARALAAPGDPNDPLRQGIDLVFRRFLDALGKRGITVIEPLGEPFDPHVHEAVARVHSPGHRDGEIVEVFSRGFRIGERLLRPAMVKVATS